jgi:predicted esterase
MSTSASGGAGSASGARRVKAEGTALVVQPKAPQTAAIILMHGLGDTAHGWIDVASEVLSPALPYAKLILPTAATRPITINGGYPMPGWYDIASLSRSRAHEKCDGIDDSVARIQGLIDAEVAAGVPRERIVLAGFSQGGALALFTGLNQPGRLAGIVAMSAYLPLPEKVKPAPEALATPVLLCHGDADGVVPLDFGKDALARVKGAFVRGGGSGGGVRAGINRTASPLGGGTCNAGVIGIAWCW